MSSQQPGVDPPFTRRTPRVVAAIKLQKRKDREQVGRFLAEGPPAVASALTHGSVREIFVTADRHADYADSGPPVSIVTDDAMSALAETVHPQGVVAVCDTLDVPLRTALAREPRLVAVAVEINDPGNAGTILRTADAAGAEVVVFAGAAVDPYNGKCVRASAGSLFHVDVVRVPDPVELLDELRAAGLLTLATSGYAEHDLDALLDAGRLGVPTAWLFGSEAHGLAAPVLDRAELGVRVPIHGRAESLNLAAAAAVCLYASARAQRSPL
ncbi:TrmH family RNA methyltransferase [Allocatelliglobosispora scoriae]|uniref:TrmH family RNA methyltransferase n=1 Tax=Allocatelliglobosispora scoriae TaxID=643052 RepID=A0A841C2A2_9ACTN|nr:RNA methyltransferase [Allocatelliglobosispora scoriae]MBB5873182.1 TrmH family RNA methyltransferase [Allocatelliglobosispora scoriae]